VVWLRELGTHRLGHLSLGVSGVAASQAFYDAIAPTIGSHKSLGPPPVE
jgi:hypothetical protein